jgi:hypothetical protein
VNSGILFGLYASAASAVGAQKPDPPEARPVGFLAALRQARGLTGSRSRREQAQEKLLTSMADRVAQLEIALLCEQRLARQQALRAEAAEKAVLAMQTALTRSSG